MTTRAVVRRPGIYLFDDSFSALDLATDARLRAALEARLEAEIAYLKDNARANRKEIAEADVALAKLPEMEKSAKAADWAFDRHYAGMYHFILGTVIGSSLAIFPTVVFTAEALEKSGLGLGAFLAFCGAMLAAGVFASWLFSKVEDRYSSEREAIETSR